MNIFKSRLRLVRGTRFTSFLFIAVSIAIAAGIMWAANMYYDIDAGKVIVGEIQRITQRLEVVTSIDVGGTATTTGTAITFAGAGNITTGASSVWKTTGAGSTLIIQSADTLTVTSTGAMIFATAGEERARILTSGYFGIATSTPSAQLAVKGDVMVDGDLKFVGAQTIEGSGTLTIKPTNTLYLFTTVNYIDSSGNMVLSGYASSTKVISPELEYSGNITIDANSASGNTTVTVTNQDGTYVANLVVEGTLQAAGVTTTDKLYVTANGAKITGNVDITSGNLTVQGNVLPQATQTYTLGSSSLWWANLYTATTTIGSAASSLTIDLDDIRAPGAFTVYSGNSLNITLNSAGAIVFQPASNSNVDVELGGTGLFRVGSADQFYIDASGNATTSGSFYAATIRTAADDATVRKKGDQIVRGVVPIFGFDLPVRCKTSCNAGTYATITRVVENDDDIFPTAYPGTTRKYKFAIRYADATTTTKTTWQVATSSDPTYVSQFTLPPTDSTDLAKGFATTTSPITLPTTDDWFLRVTTGGSGNYELQVYDILLIGLDEVN